MEQTAAKPPKKTTLTRVLATCRHVNTRWRSLQVRNKEASKSEATRTKKQRSEEGNDKQTKKTGGLVVARAYGTHAGAALRLLGGTGQSPLLFQLPHIPLVCMSPTVCFRPFLKEHKRRGEK